MKRRSYMIRIRPHEGIDEEIIITEKKTGEEIAQYRVGNDITATSLARRMRQSIDAHLADGGTLGNYQW